MDASTTQHFIPNKWVAGLLGLVAPPAGILYVGRWRLAVAYLCVAVLAIAVLCQFGSLFPYRQINKNFEIGGWIYCVICSTHSFLLAGETELLSRSWYGRWYGILIIVSVFLVAIFGVRRFIVEPFQARGSSMAPSIPKDALFLVSKVGFDDANTYKLMPSKVKPTAVLRRGDTVAFFYPDKPSEQSIKRIIGLSGDHIVYRNKVLSVNDKVVTSFARRVDQHTVATERLDGTTYEIWLDGQNQTKDFEVWVPDGSYFLLGDNRDNSFDSRMFGVVPGELLTGKVTHVFPR